MTESPAVQAIDRLIARFGVEAAHAKLDEILDQLSNIELAALAYDWRGTWARPKQLVPDTNWVSYGHLTARGTGKTKSIAAHLVGEIEAGRITHLGLCAQNEEKTFAVNVKNLIAESPPWFKPEWIATQRILVWPNGVDALAFTPEVPGAIRSENFDACWLSEIQSWPVATMREAWLNFQFATRIGRAQTFWDATPKKGHPILKMLLANGELDPSRHIVVRGTMYENRRNLGRGVLRKLEAEYGGTAQGREELLGEMLDEVDGALVKQAWVENCRRAMPGRLARRVISVDPSVTVGRGSDKTGIVDVGLGADGQLYVCGDDTGKHRPEKWGELVIKRYFDGGCDVVITETNKGGLLVPSTLRLIAALQGIEVVELESNEVPRPHPSVIYIRKVHARGAKEDRARPLSTAYEKGRVSHVLGAPLSSLEESLTTWEPGKRTAEGDKSPGDIDALAHAAIELLGLTGEAPPDDPKKGFEGIVKASEALRQPGAGGLRAPSLNALLPRRGRIL